MEPYRNPDHPKNNIFTYGADLLCEQCKEQKAGTAWSPYFCFSCNVKRMDLIEVYKLSEINIRKIANFIYAKAKSILIRHENKDFCNKYDIRIGPYYGFFGYVDTVIVLGKAKKQFIRNPPEPDKLSRFLSDLRELNQEFLDRERSIKVSILRHKVALDFIRDYRAYMN